MDVHERSRPRRGLATHNVWVTHTSNYFIILIIPFSSPQTKIQTPMEEKKEEKKEKEISRDKRQREVSGM